MAFYKGVYAYAIIVQTRADQLLPQLLMEPFDTLPIQCRHIERMHEGIWFNIFFFYKMTAMRTFGNSLYNFSLIRLLYMHRSCLHGLMNSYHSF